MDLAFLRNNPKTIDRLLTHQRIRTTPISTQTGSGTQTHRLTLDDGTDLFAKERSDGPPDFFRVEAHCLDWLREANAVPVPSVIAVTDHVLVTEWIEPGTPTKDSASELGRNLAQLHAAGAPTFGASWQGYVGRLPLDNHPTDTWAEFYCERTCMPFLRRVSDADILDATERQKVEKLLHKLPSLTGPAEDPARIHGDLWSGNVHFDSHGQGWLIDGAAAHGGHRETDLACLILFGAPHLDHLVKGYEELSPLADGWRDRVGLHQIYHLLVHCELFGRSYVPQLLQTVEQYL